MIIEKNDIKKKLLSSKFNFFLNHFFNFHIVSFIKFTNNDYLFNCNQLIYLNYYIYKYYYTSIINL